MINTIQILTLLPLQKLVMPPFLGGFFSVMNSFNFQIFDFNFIEKVFILGSSQEPLNDPFSDAGYETSNILYNASDVFIFVF